MDKVIVNLQTQFRRLFFFILLHSMDLANKKYCDNGKFPLFLFRPLHSLYTRPIHSLTLDKPKYGSPIFGKPHAASHYTTGCTEPLQYYRYFLTHNPKEYLYG